MLSYYSDHHSAYTGRCLYKPVKEFPFHVTLRHKINIDRNKTREGFLRKNIVAVSFFQNCAIHQYS